MSNSEHVKFLLTLVASSLFTRRFNLDIICSFGMLWSLAVTSSEQNKGSPNGGIKRRSASRTRRGESRQESSLVDAERER